MDKTESLSHSKWECKYHVVFIPKCRRKALYGELRKHLGEVFRRLPLQRFPADGSAKIDTVVTVLTRDARYQPSSSKSHLSAGSITMRPLDALIVTRCSMANDASRIAAELSRTAGLLPHFRMTASKVSSCMVS